MNSQFKPSRRVPQRETDLETNTFPFVLSPQRCKFLGSPASCLNGVPCRDKEIQILWCCKLILPVHPGFSYQHIICVRICYLFKVLPRDSSRTIVLLPVYRKVCNCEEFICEYIFFHLIHPLSPSNFYCFLLASHLKFIIYYNCIYFTSYTHIIYICVCMN